jgi:formylglycine-generating enzyme required for sulfatase activity
VREIQLEWVQLEAACFTMGETRIYREEGPTKQTCVESFSITTHEITNSQFQAFVDATGYRTRAERGWSAEETEGPGIDLPPGSALFAPPARSVRDLDWWRYQEGVNWR